MPWYGWYRYQFGTSESQPQGDGQMATTEKTITVENAHGLFRCSPIALDAALNRCLPGSVQDLRNYFCARVEARPGEYDDVTSVGELLIMIAEIDGPDA